jgi:uncharacterized Zn finger protein (UPF0148 family)
MVGDNDYYGLTEDTDHKGDCSTCGIPMQRDEDGTLSCPSCGNRSRQ